VERLGSDPSPRPPAKWQLLRSAKSRMARRYHESAVVARFQSADVINRGMLFAAVLFLCLVPFLIVLQSVAGRTEAEGFIKRFGLTGEAAYAVRKALTAPVATSTAVNGLSWVFFVLGGIAAAAAIQELYEKVFDVEGRGMRHTPQRVMWLGVTTGAIFLEGWAYPVLAGAGGSVLVAIVSAFGATLFWWFSMWLLLAGRRTWQELFPSALATGICWFGMVLVFRLTLPSSIASDYRKYGSIGVVFALMSLLIAIGVVILLGALLGLAWRERGKAPPASSTPPH
jgi:membrane protein